MLSAQKQVNVNQMGTGNLSSFACVILLFVTMRKVLWKRRDENGKALMHKEKPPDNKVGGGISM